MHRRSVSMWSPSGTKSERSRSRQVVIRPSIAAANAGARDAQERVGGLDNSGVANVLNANVAGSIHERGFHLQFPFVLFGNSQVTVTSPEPTAAARPSGSSMRPTRV